MRKIFVLIFLCLGLNSFSQNSDNTYTLLDFYKDNWAKDNQSGNYYQKQDIDSFKRVNTTFKSGIDNVNGLSQEEVKKIFGDPNKIKTGNIGGSGKTHTDYMYIYSSAIGEPAIWGMYFEFDDVTGKSFYFATYIRVSKFD